MAWRLGVISGNAALSLRVAGVHCAGYYHWKHLLGTARGIWTPYTSETDSAAVMAPEGLNWEAPRRNAQSTRVYPKSFRAGHLERELQMVQLSATRCSCIAILWVIVVSFAAITLCVASQRVFIVVRVYFVIDSVRKFFDTPSLHVPQNEGFNLPNNTLLKVGLFCYRFLGMHKVNHCADFRLNGLVLLSCFESYEFLRKLSLYIL
jgi:hypothetical protein